MVMLLNLNRAEQAAYERALTGVYYKQIRVSLLTRNGQPVEDLTDAFMDGEVVLDEEGDTDRACNITILDPKHKYGFDADTYQGGDLDLSRMIRVFWVLSSRKENIRVTIPVHTGPITKLRREGPIVQIEAQGKEIYGLQPARRTLTIKKGAQRTDALRTIMRRYMSEERMSIPDLAPRLGDHLVIRPTDQPWKVAQKLAQSLGRQLFFDGSGTLILRMPPQDATWRFVDGVNGGLISEPTTDADLKDVINHVRCVGRTPKGKKTPVAGAATAAPSHPLSPQNLGPTGAPMYLTENITNGNLRTAKECDAAAKVVLDRRLRLIHSTSFEAVPVPHLDPGDLVRVRTDFENVLTRVESFTLPLGLGGNMQVGWTSRYRLWKKNRKRKKV